MRNDKKIRNLITNIEYQCKQYLNYVSTTNECAYSDRYLEKIIQNTKLLENMYNKQFEKNKEVGNER